jgi:hypothetical protein
MTQLIEFIITYPELTGIVFIIFCFLYSFREFSQIKRQQTEFRHLLMGVDGKNGFRSRVKHLENTSEILSDRVRETEKSIAGLEAKIH